MTFMPKEDYDAMIGACDVGMIFLDHRFTIPNFPSRLLAYMQAKIPVLACTDSNTDIGKFIIENNFGWWCQSDSVSSFHECIERAMECDRPKLGDNAYTVLTEKYGVQNSYGIISKHFNNFKVNKENT